jgi:hypothetical protein
MQRKKGKATLNRRLKEFYGFIFEPKDGDLQIVTDPTFKISLNWLFTKIGTRESGETRENGENGEKTSSLKRYSSPVSQISPVSPVSQTPKMVKTSEGIPSKDLESLENLEGLEETDPSKNNDKEHQNLKSSLFTDLQKLIKTLRLLQNKEGQAIAKKNFFEEMHEKQRWNEVFFEKVLTIAIRDGAIYEPRPGFYGVTE